MNPTSFKPSLVSQGSDPNQIMYGLKRIPSFYMLQKNLFDQVGKDIANQMLAGFIDYIKTTNQMPQNVNQAFFNWYNRHGSSMYPYKLSYSGNVGQNDGQPLKVSGIPPEGPARSFGGSFEQQQFAAGQIPAASPYSTFGGPFEQRQFKDARTPANSFDWGIGPNKSGTWW